MSNSRKTRKPFEADVKTAPRGGIKSVHRFGTSGQWAEGSSEDVDFVAELLYVGMKPPYYKCTDCDSIVTGLRTGPDGPYEMVGITHEPGCP